MPTGRQRAPEIRRNVVYIGMLSKWVSPATNGTDISDDMGGVGTISFHDEPEDYDTP